MKYRTALKPCLPEALAPELVDLIAALSSASEWLGHLLHPKSAASLADLVRVMNAANFRNYT
ncbi:MAG: hypothetical protein WCG19_01130 [Chlorobiaceae bacterium]